MGSSWSSLVLLILSLRLHSSSFSLVTIYPISSDRYYPRSFLRNISPQLLDHTCTYLSTFLDPIMFHSVTISPISSTYILFELPPIIFEYFEVFQPRPLVIVSLSAQFPCRSPFPWLSCEVLFHPGHISVLRVTIVEIFPSLESSIEPQGLSEEISKQFKTIFSSNISLSV